MPGRRNLCDRDGRCCGPSASAVRSRCRPATPIRCSAGPGPPRSAGKCSYPIRRGPSRRWKVLRGKDEADVVEGGHGAAAVAVDLADAFESHGGCSGGRGTRGRRGEDRVSILHGKNAMEIRHSSTSSRVPNQWCSQL